MLSLPNYPLYFVVAVFAGFTGFSHAGAATMNQPFSSPEGGIPAGWELVQNGSSGSYTVGISEVVAGGGDWRMLMLRNSGSFDSVSNNQSLYYVEGGQIADFQSEVVFRAYGANAKLGKGLIARSSSSGSTLFDGYLAYVLGITDSETNETVYTLTISKDPAPGSGNQRGVALASSDLASGLSGNTDYLFRFSAVGDALTASIYAADGEGDYTVELASVFVNDSTYASGYFGLKSFPDGQGRGVYFSDLQVTVIPEPGGLALGAFGLAWSAFFGLRRRRQGCEARSTHPPVRTDS